MKLAWILPKIPWPMMNGGALRMHHLMRQAQREHEVHAVCIDDPAQPPEPPPGTCSSVTVLPADMSKRTAQLRSLFGRHCSSWHEFGSKAVAAWLGQYGQAMDAIVLDSCMVSWQPVPEGIPRILATHNIEHELLARTAQASDGFKSWFRQADARRLRCDEQLAVEQADQIWCCSQREADALAAWTDPERIRVVPNGVDSEQFQPGPVPDDADVPEIVFVACLNYAPNEDAAVFMAKKVWPRLRAALPGMRLGLIGGKPSPQVQALACDDIVVRGMVDSVLPYYRGARVAVVPLRAGSGTRLKILEAAAVQVPVVSTTVGAEGLDLEPDRHYLCADTAEELAAACVQTINDAQASAERARAAREWVLERYSWDAAGRVVLDGLRQIEAIAARRCVAMHP